MDTTTMTNSEIMEWITHNNNVLDRVQQQLDNISNLSPVEQKVHQPTISTLLQNCKLLSSATTEAEVILFDRGFRQAPVLLS